MKLIKFHLIVFFTSCLIQNAVYTYQTNEVIQTIYGDYCVQDPAILEFLYSRSMQRLKKINQYGVVAYVTNRRSFTRYDHSVGVMVLLARFGASTQEQLAGLLHDVSHTVFSHTTDYLFNSYLKDESYQDKIFSWFINKTELAHVLKKYHYSVDDIEPKNGSFSMLEQPLPNICADRLEYTLHGAFVEGLIDRDDIQKILMHLHYKDGNWFFDDHTIAKQFGEISLYLTKNIFTAPYDFFINLWSAQALKRALELNLITMDDIHFSVDEHVWGILSSSTDAELSKLVYKIKHYADYFMLGDEVDYDIVVVNKFRAIDPLVQSDQGLLHLTEINSDYKEKFERLKCNVNRGCYIKFVEKNED